MSQSMLSEYIIKFARKDPGKFATPECRKTCETGYSKSYENDKTYGHEPYTVEANEESIKLDIMNNGPLATGMTVYEDFVSYKNGIYKHVHGGRFMGDGGHAVRILGWGVENETKYWLVANSWNYYWGIDGPFKILRGTNESGIEKSLVAGLPNFSRSNFLE